MEYQFKVNDLVRVDNVTHGGHPNGTIGLIIPNNDPRDLRVKSLINSNRSHLLLYHLPHELTLIGRVLKFKK